MYSVNDQNIIVFKDNFHDIQEMFQVHIFVSSFECLYSLLKCLPHPTFKREIYNSSVNISIQNNLLVKSLQQTSSKEGH